MKYLIVSIITFLVIFGSGCSNSKTPEEMEAAISKSEVLKRINQLCVEMPKPADFRFVSKQFSGNTNLASIQFFYMSDKKMDEIKAFYKNWAEANGWKFLEESLWDESRYAKGNQSIVIEFQLMGDSNVEISCQEKR